MIDLKHFRENPDFYKKGWQTRGLDLDVNRLINLDLNWRKKNSELEDCLAMRKKSSEIVNKHKAKGKDVGELINEVRVLNQNIKVLENAVDELKSELDMDLLSLPNIPSELTPKGEKEKDNIIIRSWGTPKKFNFKAKAHWDLGESLEILDLSRGAKISGSGFPVYRGQGAKLERALINYFLDFHSQQSYEEYFVPFITSRKSMTGTGQLPKFEEDAYHIVLDDMFLIPTAEVPLTNLYADEILSEGQLPKYMMAYSPCFRREAGSAGADNRGIGRVHQFNKVELVKLVKPETSMLELETLVADIEHLLQTLGLHYRVIELCAGDLGFSAHRCYDIEVWSPATEKYLEVSSCSNFIDFQARRCNLKYRDSKTKKNNLIHTLNGSGLALPRCIIALLETYQNEDGSIDLPDVLSQYMDTKIIQ